MDGSAGRANDAYFHFDNDMLREVHTFLTRITVYGLRKKSLESMLAILKRMRKEGRERKRESEREEGGGREEKERRKERREEGGGEMEKERGGGGKRKRGRNGGKKELKF